MCRSYRPLKIRRKEKESLILEYVKMIDPLKGWFEVTQCRDNRSKTIANLAETTWLVRYPWLVEITYDQGGELLVHKFKNSLIDNEYGIKTKPDSLGNPQANRKTKIIHQVLGNLVRTYNIQETCVDDADQWMGILAAAAFTVGSTYHTTNDKSPGQKSFG